MEDARVMSYSPHIEDALVTALTEDELAMSSPAHTKEARAMACSAHTEEALATVCSTHTEYLRAMIEESLFIDCWGSIDLMFGDRGGLRLNSLVLGLLFPNLGDSPETDLVILPDYTTRQFKHLTRQFFSRDENESGRKVSLAKRERTLKAKSPADSKLRYILPRREAIRPMGPRLDSWGSSAPQGVGGVETRAGGEPELSSRLEAEQTSRVEAEKLSRVEAEQTSRVEAEQISGEKAKQPFRLEVGLKSGVGAEETSRLEAEQTSGVEGEHVSRLEAEKTSGSESEQMSKLEAELTSRMGVDHQTLPGPLKNGEVNIGVIKTSDGENSNVGNKIIRLIRVGDGKIMKLKDGEKIGDKVRCSIEKELKKVPPKESGDEESKSGNNLNDKQDSRQEFRKVKQELRQEFKKEKQELRQVCRVCFKFFPEPKTCYLHEVVTCDIFAKSPDLWTQGKTVVRPPDKKEIPKKLVVREPGFQCELCCKVFSSKLLYRNHLARHPEHQRKEYICDVCAMQFTSLSALTAHQTGEHASWDLKRHPCSYCDKVFRYPAHLAQHRRIHTKEKPFHCSLCEKQFSVKCNLKIHMETHKSLEDRKFKCKMCGHAATSQVLLDLHVNSHTGHKPFACDDCGISYRRPASLRRHMKAGCGPKLSDLPGIEQVFYIPDNPPRRKKRSMNARKDLETAEVHVVDDLLPPKRFLRYVDQVDPLSLEDPPTTHKEEYLEVVEEDLVEFHEVVEEVEFQEVVEDDLMEFQEVVEEVVLENTTGDPSLQAI